MAGRKQKYGEGTVTVAFRVPAEAKPLVMAYINKIREEWKQKQ